MVFIRKLFKKILTIILYFGFIALITVDIADAGENTWSQEETQNVPVVDALDIENTDIEVYIFDLANVPAYTGEPYCILNNNQPTFSKEEIVTESFEEYSELDFLGRCGVTFANISTDIMPTEERGEIGHIRPSGWHTVKYNGIIDGNYLYNRCHLIGYQLAGENANEKNLITGTRYLNIEGMLPFENMVAEYVRETENHVLYRVTPVFEGDNLVATGVIMEAYSIEDSGLGICFNVFCYNVQPGITINYADGTSYSQNKTETRAPATGNYVLNTNSKKFHYPSCSSVSRMSAKNREDSNLSRDVIVSYGYSPCGICKP